MAELKIGYDKSSEDIPVLVVSRVSSIAFPYRTGCQVVRVITGDLAETMYDCLIGKQSTVDVYKTAMNVLAAQLSDATGCDYQLAIRDAIEDAKQELADKKEQSNEK